jgi:tetratricopeptide (TPR) repeat protein
LRALADLTARYGEKEEAVELLKKLAEQTPEDSAIPFMLGHLLLEQQNEEEGIRQMQQAFALNPLLKMDCCQAIYTYYKQQGKHEEADRYLDEFYNGVSTVVKILEDRYKLSNGSKFLPHGLAPDAMAVISDALVKHECIKRCLSHTEGFDDRPSAGGSHLRADSRPALAGVEVCRAGAGNIQNRHRFASGA